MHRCLETGDLLIILGIHICENGVLSLRERGVRDKAEEGIVLHGRLTAGISFGKATSLVKSLAPDRGHVSSTCFICSHRSALVLTRVIKPYLTDRLIYASCSTSSVKLPFALIWRFLPLETYKPGDALLIGSKLTFQADLDLSLRCLW